MDLTQHSGSGLFENLISQLRLPEESIALALIYTHRFNKWQDARSTIVLDQNTLSMAAVSLAAKISERPRRLREILVPAYNHLLPEKPKLTYPSALYDTLRSSLVTAELLLLRVLKFDLRIATPSEYTDDILRDYVDFSKTEKSHFEDYTTVSDSLVGLATRVTVLKALKSSRIALGYTARTIATSCVIMAARSLGMKPLGDHSTSTLETWITDVAREHIDDVSDCLEDLATL